MPTFLYLCSMFLEIVGFVFVMIYFCYGVVWLVKYKQFKKQEKILKDCVQKSKPKKQVVPFHEILEHKN